MADIDAELERRRRDERLQRAVLQPVLGVETNLLRQAAVMRGDGLLAQPLAQVTRRPLGHLSRVDEDQRRLVLGDELGQAVVVLLPHFMRHDGVELLQLLGDLALVLGDLLTQHVDAPARLVIVEQALRRRVEGDGAAKEERNLPEHQYSPL